MPIPRRHFLRLTAAGLALPFLSRIARAQAYPVRPVRIVVGYPAGGPIDIVARLIGQSLTERLGQQFIIENRPGAGGNVGAEAVVRAPADGYTLLLVGSNNFINATLYDKLNFNFINDIAPIASISGTPLVMEVNPSVPATTVPEFIAFAKANPGKLNMASGGQRHPGPCRRRAIQDDGGHPNDTRAVSRLSPRAYRSAGRNGPRNVRHDFLIDRPH
jgi:tripartite-type tricarboxylate transporter receptor subunit TctC